MHLTEYGYRLFASDVEFELKVPYRDYAWGFHIDGDGAVVEQYGAKVSDVQRTETGWKFTVLSERLVPPELLGLFISFQVDGLKSGRYKVLTDGKSGMPVTTTGSLSVGYAALAPAEIAQAEKLRTAINAKNQLYFYRWRPQNETYLFGFRKHEQGKNAAEVVQFDPLIAEKEAEIAKLRVPQPHQYEIVREPDEKK